VPDELMADMGAQAFEQMKASRPLATDASTTARVDCVARHIIEASKQRYPDVAAPASWEVVVFDDPTANAFALPGGKIGVHSGLLQVAETNAQLAAVMGHEVAHLLAGHGNETLTQRLGVNGVLLLIGLVFEIDSQLLMEALGLGAHLGLTLPFSRAHESEADVMGLEIMATAGFEPEESTDLWQNMAAGSGGQPPEFLSTHPGHDTRIEQLNEHMNRARSLYRWTAPASCPG